MPSPLAHVAVCASLWAAFASRIDPRTFAVVAFASIAPDADLLIGVVLDTPVGWHRGPSHSLVGAAAIGLLLTPLVRGAWARMATVGACIAHVPLDWSTGNPGDPVRYGVPWAWPFDPSRAIASNPWFGSFHIDHPGFLLNLLDPDALRPWLIEVATAATAVALALLVRRLR